MKRLSMKRNLDTMPLFLQGVKKRRLEMTPVNSPIINNRNQSIDPKQFSQKGTRIICSADITRQSLQNTATTSKEIVDDDEFFERMKMEIDKDLLIRSKENYVPHNSCQPISWRKKKCIFHGETQNIIDRFKKDIECKNPRRPSTVQPLNTINHAASEKRVIMENTTVNSNIQFNHLYSSDILNNNLRNPADKFLFQVASTMRKDNDIITTINETRTCEMEVRELLFYNLKYITPPCSDDDSDTINYYEDFEI